jgi:DNA-binding transcriptional MerR regulator
MYTPGQVSEMLDIPPATLRRYSAEYREFLSEDAKLRGRRRAYTDSDLVVLQRIRQYYGERRSPKEIKKLLQVVDTQEERSRSDRDSALMLLPGLAQEFQHIRESQVSIHNKLDSQGETIQEVLSEVRAYREELRQEQAAARRRELIRIFIFVGLFVALVVGVILINSF